MGETKTVMEAAISAAFRVMHDDILACAKNKERWEFINEGGVFGTIEVAPGNENGLYAVAFYDVIGEMALALLVDGDGSLNGWQVICDYNYQEVDVDDAVLTLIGCLAEQQRNAVQRRQERIERLRLAEKQRHRNELKERFKVIDGGITTCTTVT